jgi:hypothetical protein
MTSKRYLHLGVIALTLLFCCLSKCDMDVPSCFCADENHILQTNCQLADS